MKETVEEKIVVENIRGEVRVGFKGGLEHLRALDYVDISTVVDDIRDTIDLRQRSTVGNITLYPDGNWEISRDAQ